MKMFYSLFPIPIWNSSIFLQAKILKHHGYMAWHFFFLVHFFVSMVLESRIKRVVQEEEDEEVGYSGFDQNLEEEYLGEEEGESGDDEATPTKFDQTPLWKYFISRERGWNH